MSSPSPSNELQQKKNLQNDIQTLRFQIEDGLAMGDSMFGQYAHAEVAQEVSERVRELQKKKKELEEDIRRKEAWIERSNRDFSDVKESLPETQEQQRVRFIEDYTVMFLLLSYVFLLVSVIVHQVALSLTPWPTLFRSLGYSVVGTLFLSALFYLIV